MYFINCLFQATEFAVRGMTDGAIPASIALVSGTGTNCANDYISIDGMSKVVDIKTFTTLFVVRLMYYLPKGQALTYGVQKQNFFGLVF